MKIRTIHRETWVELSIEKVFTFFANPDNLLKVTPNDIPITILNEEKIIMKEGTEVNLKMKLFGFLPVKWQTKIIEWDPPNLFVDIQPKGPYKYWRHEHKFEEQDGGTLIIDHVEFGVPGWIFEPLIYIIAVKNNLKKLFDYREQMYPKFLNNTNNKETHQ